jgi:thiol-disulfide isomerase/thioredoxin
MKLFLLTLVLSLTIVSPGVIGQRRSTKKVDRTVAPSITEIAVTEINAERLKEVISRQSSGTRPLLVNFWATWCEPCREEYPDLVKIDSQFKSKGLDFVTVSLDDVGDIKTKVPEFLKDMHAGMPAYLLNTPDPDVAIAAVDANWSGSLPATFLMNKKGEVVYRHFGRIKPDELLTEIQKLTSEK